MEVRFIILSSTFLHIWNFFIKKKVQKKKNRKMTDKHVNVESGLNRRSSVK